jgi:hydroxymethylglutaryl-CoA reductase
MVSSRLPGFYELPIRDRAALAARVSGLSKAEEESLFQFGSLSGELTDIFIENSIGTFSLPLGVATNFLINGKDILIPMAVEETSVLAAASHGAKLIRMGGGFIAESTDPITTGQIQIHLRGQSFPYEKILADHKNSLLAYANRGQERLLARGGGAKDLTWYKIPEIDCLILNLHVHTGDAMGANIVNTMVEKISVFMPNLFPGSELGLRILTNLTHRRMARARCLLPKEAFSHRSLTGSEVIEKIIEAYAFAYHDPYRAATHNKGVMNGIDPVLIATGNDWRAVEAGAHAHAAHSGVYRPMTNWKRTEGGDLEGSIELPMAVGTVGGVTKLHPTAQAALGILGRPGAMELAQIIVCVGLAQNLSALRALATEGIQRGHMGLHQKNKDLLKTQTAAGGGYYH